MASYSEPHTRIHAPTCTHRKLFATGASKENTCRFTSTIKKCDVLMHLNASINKSSVMKKTKHNESNASFFSVDILSFTRRLPAFSCTGGFSCLEDVSVGPFNQWSGRSLCCARVCARSFSSPVFFFNHLSEFWNQLKKRCLRPPWPTTSLPCGRMLG